jgi:hypothetical protein
MLLISKTRFSTRLFRLDCFPVEPVVGIQSSGHTLKLNKLLVQVDSANGQCTPNTSFFKGLGVFHLRCDAWKTTFKDVFKVLFI